MEAEPSRRSLKRPLDDADDFNERPPEKRVRFPKGKKRKDGTVTDDSLDSGVPRGEDVGRAARERALRRKGVTPELLDGENVEFNYDVSKAEVHYEDEESLADEGIQIEPFNLDKEREEGYFDESGNYVEYVNNNEFKDAWLDSAEVDKKFTGAHPLPASNENEPRDLTSSDLAKINRRIADVLQPGETVLQALRRLKGTSNKKEKMSAETKLLFDQLTEDAMTLMENGDYNVYEERQETFQREAAGYESLAQTRVQGTASMRTEKEKSEGVLDEGFLANNGTDAERPSSRISDMNSGPSELNASAATNNNEDAFDMFAEDDESTAAKSTSAAGVSVSDHLSESGDVQSDYVYDEASGYYYSSSLGYYYDPSTQLYCSAASGQWYSYEAESGTYKEVQSGTHDEARTNVS